MTHIHLSFYERLGIANIVGQHQVPRLREAAILLRILEKVRITDTEMSEAQFKAVGSDQVSWRVPSPRYGERDVALEAEEAQALAQVFDAVENIRVSDAAWICRLADSLRPVEEQAA
jgi:hypothetical protein